MTFFKWLLAGAVGAAIGGVVWVLVGYYAEREVGWIAWGIGGLAGLAVRLIAGEQERGPAPGLAAVAAAAAGIALSKYVVVWLLVSNALAEMQTEPITDEAMIVSAADDIIREEYDALGKPVPWKPGMSFDEAEAEADYPPEIWQRAKADWEGLPEEERSSRKETARAERAEFQQEMGGMIRQGAFAASFSGWDLLWFGLAMYTAYQIASATGQEEQHPAPAAEA